METPVVNQVKLQTLSKHFCWAWLPNIPGCRKSIKQARGSLRFVTIYLLTNIDDPRACFCQLHNTQKMPLCFSRAIPRYNSQPAQGCIGLSFAASAAIESLPKLLLAVSVVRHERVGTVDQLVCLDCMGSSKSDHSSADNGTGWVSCIEPRHVWCDVLSYHKHDEYHEPHPGSSGTEQRQRSDHCRQGLAGRLHTPIKSPL